MSARQALFLSLLLPLLTTMLPSSDAEAARGVLLIRSFGLELDRSGIREARLPRGSVVQFRELSPWQKYKWEIIGVLALCGVETVLILALLAQLRQRQRAEGALRESEQRMQLAAEAADVGMWALDLPQGRIWASERARQLYGMAPKEEITFQTFLDLVHPEDRSRVDAAVQRVAQGGERLREYYRVIQPNGDVRWMLAIGSLATHAARETQQLMGASLDVTERKVAEEALRRERALTEAVFDSVPGLLYLYTAEGKLVRWNKKHEELTGYTGAELAGFKATDWFRGESLAVMMRAWERAFTGGQASAELNLIIKGGAETPYLLTGVRVEFDGKSHLVGIGIDLTERRKAEAELARMNRHLQSTTRFAVLGELSGAIAHELKQPLAGVLSTAQAGELMLKSGTCERSEMATLLGEIVADTKRAAAVIRNLQDLYRDRNIEFETVNAGRFVEEALRLVESELLVKKVTLTTDRSGSAARVQGNRVQLEQVLVNLILNAAQAMDGLAESDRRILIATAQDGGEVRVWVEDNGPGIDASNLDRIFEPLATWRPGGLGLGLAVSQRIIEGHGGRMWAENMPRRGAKVGFILPLAAGSQAEHND